MDNTDKKIKISITGDLGSGKSTVCKLIEEKYGVSVYSIGLLQRAYAQKLNMSTLEFNTYMESHPEIDEELDTSLTEIGQKDEDMILDSRMAWHFVPQSFKVYLSVDIKTAAYRIMCAERGDVETYTCSGDAEEKLMQRKLSENYRYLTKYGVDCSNLDNYDLIINTDMLLPQDITKIIMTQYKLWANGERINKFWA